MQGGALINIPHHTQIHTTPQHTHTKGHSHCGTLDLIGLSWTQSLRHTASRKWLLRYSDTRGCNSGTWPWISFFRPLNQDTFYPLVFALAAPVKLIFFSVPFLNHPHPVWLRSKRFKQGPIWTNFKSCHQGKVLCRGKKKSPTSSFSKRSLVMAV